MPHIFTPKRKAQRERTDRDIYLEDLEKAYGDLPVPSDDYADIKELLGDEQDFDELEQAIETIREHYHLVAEKLGREWKYC